jgi:hypothetical protein
MAKWLKSLLSRISVPPRHLAPKQDELDASTARIADGEIPTPKPTDHALPKQEAALAADFQSIRDAALDLIAKRLDVALAPKGFLRNGTVWSRNVERGKASLRLQRCNSGQKCHLELTYTPAPGTFAARQITAPLGSFLQPGDEPHRDSRSEGKIEYSLVVQNPAILDIPMQVLEVRALPWLMAQNHWRPTGVERFRDHPL